MGTNAFDLYWKGDFKIQLDSIYLSGTSLANNPEGVRFLNRAFELFYLCRQGTMKCKDEGMKAKMTKELEDAATEGMGGTDCDDLREAIKHATKYKTKEGFNAPYNWFCDKTESYGCVKYHRKMHYSILAKRATIWQGGNVTSIKGAVRFMKEMDKRSHLLYGYFMEFDKKARRIQKEGTKIFKNGANPAETDWKTLGTTIKTIKTIADASQDYMWLMPSSVYKKSKIALPYLGKASSFLDLAGRIHQLGDDMKYDSGNRGNAQQITGNVAVGALKQVLEFIPGLGSFYAQALDMMPGVEAWITKLTESRVREIEEMFRQARGGKTAMDSSGALGRAHASYAGDVKGGSRDVRIVLDA